MTSPCTRTSQLYVRIRVTGKRGTNQFHHNSSDDQPNDDPRYLVHPLLIQLLVDVVQELGRIRQSSVQRGASLVELEVRADAVIESTQRGFAPEELGDGEDG